jgi:hypothetical protein
VEGNSARIAGTHMPVGEAVHSINGGHEEASKLSTKAKAPDDARALNYSWHSSADN